MKTKMLCFVGLLVLVFGSVAAARAAENLQIKGYDPVAYFTAGKPAKGDSKFEYKWMDGTYRFATQENLELFKKTPEKYAPQYGGYCAYGMSEGYPAPIDPEAWTIVNGKLYLNYNKSVQKRWLENRDQRIIQADKNWPAIKAAEQKKKANKEG